MTSRPRGSGAVSRRRLLGIGAAVVVGNLALPSLVHARTPGPRELDFLNLHTGEALRTTYWADGAYLPDALADVNYLLRDFRTGDVKAIDVGLLNLLHDLRTRLDSTEAYQVISGYRSPKTNNMLASQSNGVAKKSLHMKGLAIDVSLPQRKLSDLRQVAMEMRRGGVGYYPKSGFVHLDVGRVRYW
jgi:uncharacterized protein YcbK (DUF882 family)